MLNNQVSKAVRLAIAFGTASTAVFSANSIAAEEGVENSGIPVGVRTFDGDGTNLDAGGFSWNVPCLMDQK